MKNKLTFTNGPTSLLWQRSLTHATNPNKLSRWLSGWAFPTNRLIDNRFVIRMVWTPLMKLKHVGGNHCGANETFSFCISSQSHKYISADRTNIDFFNSWSTNAKQCFKPSLHFTTHSDSFSIFYYDAFAGRPESGPICNGRGAFWWPRKARPLFVHFCEEWDQQCELLNFATCSFLSAGKQQQSTNNTGTKRGFNVSLRNKRCCSRSIVGYGFETHLEWDAVCY